MGAALYQELEAAAARALRLEEEICELRARAVMVVDAWSKEDDSVDHAIKMLAHTLEK